MGTGEDWEIDAPQANAGISEGELRATQQRKLQLEIQDLGRSAWTRSTTWFNLMGVVVASAVAATGWIYKSIERESAQVKLDSAQVKLDKAQLDLRMQTEETDKALREKNAELDQATIKAAALTVEAERARSDAERARGEANAQLELAKQAQGKVVVAQEELKGLQKQIGAIQTEIADSGAGTVAPGVARSVDAAAEAVTQSLQKLTLSPESTDDDLGQLLERNHGVLELDLAFCKKITDAGLAHLALAPGLTSLNLLGCEGVTDAGMVEVGKLTALHYLTLSSTRIGDAGLRHLSSLIQLEMLQLMDADGITGAGIGVLRALPISTILASFSNVGNDDLDSIATLPTLETLYLSYTRVTDAGLEKLARSANLRSLWLDGCDISDVALAVVAPLKLESLVVTNCPAITCAGLARLAASPLKNLHASSCTGLVEGELPLLAQLVNVTFLNLSSNPQLGSAAVDALAASMPWCETTHH